MPNCFQLIDKAAGKPAVFAQIDDRMCADFNVVPHANNYYCSWYDIIGFKLALGWDFDRIEADHADPSDEFDVRILRITKWLRERYESAAWYERKGM